jgi:hypothetical protein
MKAARIFDHPAFAIDIAQEAQKDFPAQLIFQEIFDESFPANADDALLSVLLWT